MLEAFSERTVCMTKIYVGNLPFSANEGELRQLFEEFGTVNSVALINDRETGRPRGFGFVEMPNADAARAIQALNGKDMGGRPLRINEAQERERGGGGGGGGGGRRFGGGGGGGDRDRGGGGGGRW
jgi:RNA recognition motif-containing protein